MKKRFHYVIIYGESRWLVWSELGMYALALVSLGYLIGVWVS